MSDKKHGYDYGECDMCGTPLDERLITVVNAEVGQQIFEMLQRPDITTNAPRISVPVLMFDDVALKAAHA